MKAEPGSEDVLTQEQGAKVKAAQNALEAVIGSLDFFELMTLTVWTLKERQHHEHAET